jgi:hypothetical protein
MLLAFLLGALSAPAALQAQEAWVGRISEALDRMASGYHLPEVRAAFGSFSYGYTGLGSAFSRFLEETLTRAITGSKRVKLFARHAVQSMDASYREVYRDYFQTAEADALLYGRFSTGDGGTGGGVALHLELASLSTGELLGAADLLLPAAAVPAGLSLEPPGLNQAESLKSSLTDLLAAGGGRLVVQAAADRGDSPVYRAGENLQVHVFVSRDAYLKIYHVDVSGKTQLIYPNPFHPDNRVAGGSFLRIPEAHDPFQFRLGPPFGAEFIKVAASTRQFADVESAFADLQGSAREVMTRGLTVVAADAESAETLLAYTIVEK